MISYLDEVFLNNNNVKVMLLAAEMFAKDPGTPLIWRRFAVL